MNVALIHDRLNIRTFWENRITSDCQHAEREELRRSKSALNRLREDWLLRLENRNKNLKNLSDAYRKVKVEKSADPLTS